MTRMYSFTGFSHLSYRTVVSSIMLASLMMTGCTTNYLTNSTEGTYGVPVTERTIPQRLLDRSIEHTAKINVYGLQENLQQISRMDIDSFNSEVLLTGEVPSDALKAEVEKVIRSMPDVRQVYNELNVSVARGYSSTMQDGYVTSKLIAKITANNGVKPSQIKAVTNNGVVYVMGRLTPTQQSHIIDIANDTVGVVELVLLTTLVNDTGAIINEADIMSEPNLTESADTVVPSVTIKAPAGSANEPTGVTLETPNSGSNASSPYNPTTTPDTQPPVPSSSPYIDLYKER